jgi:hypothetical protein
VALGASRRGGDRRRAGSAGELGVGGEAVDAGVDPQAAVTEIDGLAAVGILADGDRIAFAHPIVRSVGAADMGGTQRGRLQLEAARLLLASGAGSDRVSAHLLAAPPAREAGVTEPLRQAAARAVAAGAPESAVRYLRRALDEPPPTSAMAGVLVELGTAEAAAAQPQAPERLKTAIGLYRAPE